MKYEHIPVMLTEALEYLKPGPGKNFVDCTLGGGGYTFAIAKMVGEGGMVLAIDADDMAIENARIKIKEKKLKNIKIIKDNFRNLSDIVKNNCGEIKFDGIVMDLGLSSAQLGDRNRGMSFQFDTPLNMSFGEKSECSTLEIVNNYNEKNLENIIKNYGEERFARQISRAIVGVRKNKSIKTTGELLKIIESAVPFQYKQGKIHFATRTFQALRIETNKELENLRMVLENSPDLLRSNGRIVVVSYHSLEDRIVKHFFKEKTKDCICPSEAPICRCAHKAELRIITKKIITPTEEEIKKNNRARSAKMRVAEKI
ncbi:16S rRNA (cytosine(1402)-N(4))-methyltransferase [Candidatus Falkowbacteria bacterium RIFOXYB2_FULL_34_18]|uniref:Ribosomal RNA small subunit methyltransferase H n=1 Tax=Candidatus Falkowbacteria bacterium RIFOXYD2_FULL_34_120 TaxID=1798007 RepID=A0A1F5TP91_9BACT|nr:MAG: 16S rRNA (cytosine(1402)-N(4))-methyltransferase [Candidatus Falkowbacteria bacterium RIFOXYC12_FULL_34_55]OGF28725.1 MAG: 16S rRNA (cytosine(1402)-N(4))-methyltransferase [Candidatus Falkowbacteria bacterium RIFOXYB2_FULL_34_18]OGF38090.1 MAG: 16S rRNA (cytosine(1402)-N(4))-methyltransferase [Candidatus Falkowbacteria bacterium RIFOXYC2_FULL_34_220]OGF38344.1 MAG: 16S rRNA (cytosine(1402)-N(4))-methyltransferase [Candidatus Falkowbacteria bacterium RIFOXYD12_FULL_34_57]OGF40331.1 MAG: 